MSKSKELFMQVRESEMNSWDAIDADYFYQKHLESYLESK
jgi:hypothetical protein